MDWLIVAVLVVMVLSLIATVMIGQSKSNKEENPNYFQQTGKKWFRLSGIYIVCVVIVAIFFIILLIR